MIIPDSKKELSLKTRRKMLKTKDKIIDTVIIGGEEFLRNSYMGLSDSEVSSFVIGCYGDRAFEAFQREEKAMRKKMLDLELRGETPIQKVMISLGYELEIPQKENKVVI